MGYDVALWGSLKLPEGGVDAWRKLTVDGDAWSDWTMWFENSEGGSPRTVEEHLAEWESFGEGSEFFTVKTVPSRVDVQAFFSEDVFIEKARSIAALFRVAERVGATGKVTFAGVGTPLAYRLTLSRKGSTFEALDEDLEQSADVEKLLRAAEKREKDRRKAEREKKKTDKGAAAKGPKVPLPPLFSVAVWAELQMKDEERLDLWKTLDIEPWGYNDWKKKDGWGWFTRYSGPEPLSNIEYLQSLNRLGLQQKGRDFFRSKVTGLKLEWRGHLDRETFLDRSLLLATVFRSAREFATSGTMVLAAVGGPGGFRFRFDKPGSAEYEFFDEDLSDTEPMKQILAELARRDERRASGQTPGDHSPAGATPSLEASATVITAGPAALPPDAALAMEQIHAILERASPEVLLAAPGKLEFCTIDLHGRPARVEDTFRTRDTMLAGLRGESKKTDASDLPSLQSASLAIAAALDPEAAEPPLRTLLLSTAPPAVRSSAAAALAGRSSDETVEALFRVLPEEGGAIAGKFGPYTNGIRRGAEHALAATGREDVGARVLAMLTPDVLAIPAGITGDFVEATPDAQEKQDFARSLLYILGVAKYRPARGKLINILRTHPLTEIRQRAAEALLFSASPEEVMGAFHEDPGSFFGRNVVIGVFNRIEVIACAERLLAHVAQERQ